MIVETDTGVIDLGTTETTPTISIVDYSRRVTDDFGVTTVVPRSFSRRLSVRLALPFDEVDTVQRQLAALRASSAIWVADERFNWLSAEGFYKDFEVDLAVPPLSYCTLTVEGIAETETVPDSEEDPAPAGSVSTFRLLKPATIDNGALANISVLENDYPQWAAGTTYAAGARVILTGTHRIYESLVAGNLGWDPVAAADKWMDIGPTNRWAMFDQALGTKTATASPMVLTLNVTEANALALLDVAASTVRVRAPGYDRTKTATEGAITFLDLPTTTGQVYVTVSGVGTVSVGTLLVGQLLDLGLTEASPSAGITDYSRKEVDDFGEVTIVQRAWAKRMSARALIDTAAIDVVANRIAAVRATPSLWIGEDGLDSLTIYGFFKDFSIEVGETVSKLSLSIEGLSEAAPIGPGGVAWTDVRDDDPIGHPRPEDGATVGAPPGTPVGDRPSEAVTGAIDLQTAHLDSLQGEVDGAQGDIADLITTYGDTASAAQSAADAAAALTTVQGIEDHIDAQKLLVDQAKAAAEAAEQGATDQAGFALADRQLAQTAKGQAETARDTAIVARDTAQGHAATATTQATVSASSSASSRLAALSQYSTRTDSLDDWRNWFEPFDPTDPLAAGPPSDSPTVVGDSGLGPTIQQTTVRMAVRASLPCVAGRKYRFRASMRNLDSGDRAARWLLYPIDANAVGLGPQTSLFGNSAPANAISVLDAVVDCDAFISAHPTVKYIRPLLTSSGGVYPGRVGRVYIEDVTESEKAAASANAALLSAATSTTKADESIQAASTAQEQAGIATAKAGEATSQAGFAEQYKADAEAAADDSASSASSSAASAVTATNKAGEAEDHASAAATAASAATAEADEAEGHSATASTQAGLAVTAKNDAVTAAGQAEDERVLAEAAKAAALNSEVLTAQYRQDALDAKGDAESAATVSTDQAAISTAQAAAAQQAFELTASVALGSLNPNPGFDDYPSAAVGAIPAEWNGTAGGTGAGYRVVDPIGGWAYRLPGGAGANAYAGYKNTAATLVEQNAYYVIEADIVLRSGALTGAGVLFRPYNATGAVLQTLALSFAGDKDTRNVVPGAGTVNRVYSFRKLVQVTAAGAKGFDLLAASHNAFIGSVAGANDIEWRRCAVRPATQQEIAAETAIPALEASVSSNTQALADHDTQFAGIEQTIQTQGASITANANAISGIEGDAAFLELVAAATGSEPAIYRMLAGKNGSVIDQVGERVLIRNPVDGELVTVADFSGGVARLRAALIRDLGVPPTDTSEIFHPVMLRPLIFLGSDGDIIQYQGGDSYGAGQVPARIEVDTSGLPALAAGESYDVRAVNITDAQFEVRAKVLTAAAGTTQTSNAGASKGTGIEPLWQTNKPTAADAYDGYYQFTLTANIEKSDLQQMQGRQDYQGSVSLYGKTSSGWQTLGFAILSGTNLSTSPPQTIAVTRTVTVQSSLDLGSGADQFGIHPIHGATITAFQRVQYVSQSSGGESPVDRALRFTVYPPA